MKERGKSWLVGLVLLFVGAAVGYAWPQSTASPNSETGVVTTVSPDSAASGTQFSFKPKGSSSAQTLMIFRSTPWETAAGHWYYKGTATLPTCLVQGDSKITVGVVTVHAVSSAPSRQLVAWIECTS
jgi:hypothetical protein